MTERAQEIERFIAASGWQHAERSILAGDASFRRYDRLRNGTLSAVLMDAPPPKEDVRPFVSIANLLRSLGLSAPKVIGENLEAGLLLLEDFGDPTYSRCLSEGANEFELYKLAVDALIHLHSAFDPEDAENIQHYDDSKFLEEALLFTDWYLPAVRGIDTTYGERSEFAALWLSVFPQARGVPETLVLRDFHVDNLMWLKNRPSVAACGLLDFQDAVQGPASYDLVSLFEDARRDVPDALTIKLLQYYCAAHPKLNQDCFFKSYAVLGAQRSTKILGIFTRLALRDGKPHYLYNISRVWRWLEGNLEHPTLAPLREWFEKVVPGDHRVIPVPEKTL
ncbi:MAG: aminoglycoside phosphotransferase [Rhodospirillaceae bacterium]|nr:aminoglycoside phosphotransferase [Rhodospirillaceae bacterium]